MRLNRLLLAASFIIGNGIALAINTGTVYAAESSLERSCQTVEAVFIRGSGQKLVKEERQNYENSIVKYLKNVSITRNLYELGTEHQYGNDGIGYKYQAVPVAGWGNGGYQHAVGAKISSGHDFDYGKSVEDGVKELAIYLNKRFGASGSCHDSRIIVAGYSQGAQVAGQLFTYNPKWVEQSVKDRVDYVALFGDPKLNLPEGRDPGLFRGGPPACRSRDAEGYYQSVWREGVPECFVAAGSLGAREPYVVDEFKFKVGLWCNTHDAVCDGSKIIVNDTEGHGKYDDEGRIEEGVKKSLFWVSTHLPQPERKALQYSLRNNGEAPVQDIATLPLPYVAEPLVKQPTSIIKTGPYYAPCKSYILIDKKRVYTNGYLWYGDASNPAPSVREQTLNPYAGRINMALKYGCEVALYISDTTISAEYSLLQAATKDASILNDALERAGVELIDMKYQSQFCDTNRLAGQNFMYGTVLKENPKPVMDILYRMTAFPCSVAAKWNGTFFDLPGIAEANSRIDGSWDAWIEVEIGDSKTSSRFISEYDQTQTYKSKNTTSTTTFNPGDMSLKFPINPYYSPSNQPVTLSVKPSNPAVSIDEYDHFMWDFDSNGTVDQVTIAPSVTHTFSITAETKVTVRAVTVYNTQVAAEVTVASESTRPDLQIARPAAPKNLSVQRKDATTLGVVWEAADQRADSWLVQINDSPPTRVQIAAPFRVTITDVEPNKALTIRVRGVTKDGYAGDATLIGILADGTLTQRDEYAQTTLSQQKSPMDSSGTASSQAPPRVLSSRPEASANGEQANTASAQASGPATPTKDTLSSQNGSKAASATQQQGTIILGAGLLIAVGGGAAIVWRQYLRRRP